MSRPLTDLAYVLAEAGDGYYKIHKRHGLNGTGYDLQTANGFAPLYPGSVVLIPGWMTAPVVVDPDPEPDPEVPPAGVRYVQAFGLFPDFHQKPDVNGSGNTWGKLNDIVTALGRWPQLLMVSVAGTTPNAFMSPAWGQFDPGSPRAYLDEIADKVNVEVLIPLNLDGRSESRPGTPEGIADIRRSLLEVAAGRDDAHHRTVARYIINGGYPNAVLRIGSEADSFDWGSDNYKDGNHDAYRAAWKHIAAVYRAESTGFQFCWTILSHVWMGSTPDYVYLGYPGDDVVDYCGMDVYFDKQRVCTDADWRRYGEVLAEHAAFAKAHGKQVCYPEWAQTNFDDDGWFRRMIAWQRSLGDRLAYANYFASGANYGQGRYDPRTYPKLWAAWVDTYKKGAV